MKTGEPHQSRNKKYRWWFNHCWKWTWSTNRPKEDKKSFRWTKRVFCAFMVLNGSQRRCQKLSVDKFSRLSTPRFYANGSIRTFAFQTSTWSMISVDSSIMPSHSQRSLSASAAALKRSIIPRKSWIKRASIHKGYSFDRTWAKVYSNSVKQKILSRTLFPPFL